MSRRTRRYLGVAQLVTALILTAQPVVQGIHHLRSPHFWCPDHHAFEHPRSKGLRLHEPIASTADVALDSDPVTDDADHDICPICQSVQQRALTSDVVDDDAVASDDIARTSEVRRAHGQLAILTLAPKHSPPITPSAPTPREPRAS